MKQAIILRCRTFGNRERHCYDFLKPYFGNEKKRKKLFRVQGTS